MLRFESFWPMSAAMNPRAASVARAETRTAPSFAAERYEHARAHTTDDSLQTLLEGTLSRAGLWLSY